MSVIVANKLTVELAALLNGQDVDSRTGKAIIVVTVDENQWPHPAMLSYYEVVAKGSERIDLAVGKASTTAGNLRRSGRVTILLTDQGMNYYIKGRAFEVRPSLSDVPFMSLFSVAVDQVLEDQEPGATITSGVTFQRVEDKKIGAIIDQVFRGVLNEP